MEYNFFWPTKIEASIRAIAKRFDATIQANAEKVIAKHRAEMDTGIAKYRPRLRMAQLLRCPPCTLRVFRAGGNWGP